MKREIYFALQKLIGSDVQKQYNEILTIERFSKEQLDLITNERLNRLLQHAQRNIPYYQKHLDGKKKLTLDNFPVITKEEINHHYKEFMTQELADEYPDKKRYRYSWKEVGTGGTSGVPLKVIHDRVYRDKGRAARLYSQYLCGFPIGTPYFRLWGSVSEINHIKDSFTGRMSSFLTGEKLFNAFMMDEERMTGYLNEINSSKIVNMMAYVDTAVELGRYSIKKGIKSKKIDSIMACAGTVSDEDRKILADAFGSFVHNKYGSRECADIACECNRGGFHIYSNNVFIEIVDDNGENVLSGKTGRILVTLLSNYSFPLIRYEIGDIGSLRNGACACGRPFPLFEKVEGRKSDFLKSTNGSFVSPVYFRHLIGVVHNDNTWIDKFQVIQESGTRYRIKLKLNKTADGAAFELIVENLKADLQKVLGEDAQIEIEFSMSIVPSKSGKFLYTINKTNSN